MSGVQETDSRGMAAPTGTVAPEGGEQALPPTSPRLFDRLREALQSRHYSHRTEDIYCHWMKRFPYFRHPREPTRFLVSQRSLVLIWRPSELDRSANHRN